MKKEGEHSLLVKAEEEMVRVVVVVGLGWRGGKASPEVLVRAKVNEGVNIPGHPGPPADHAKLGVTPHAGALMEFSGRRLMLHRPAWARHHAAPANCLPATATH